MQGKIVADLAAAVVVGGDYLADIAVLREQSELPGPVASDGQPGGKVALVTGGGTGLGATAAEALALALGAPGQPLRRPGRDGGQGKLLRREPRLAVAPRHPGRDP